MHRSLPYLFEDAQRDLPNAGRCVLAWVRSALMRGYHDGDVVVGNLAKPRLNVGVHGEGVVRKRHRPLRRDYRVDIASSQATAS
jgi:hypothetical protein